MAASTGPTCVFWCHRYLDPVRSVGQSNQSCVYMLSAYFQLPSAADPHWHFPQRQVYTGPKCAIHRHLRSIRVVPHRCCPDSESHATAQRKNYGSQGWHVALCVGGCSQLRGLGTNFDRAFSSAALHQGSDDCCLLSIPLKKTHLLRYPCHLADGDAPSMWFSILDFLTANE